MNPIVDGNEYYKLERIIADEKHMEAIEYILKRSPYVPFESTKRFRAGFQARQSGEKEMFTIWRTRRQTGETIILKPDSKDIYTVYTFDKSTSVWTLEGQYNQAYADRVATENAQSRN